MADTASIAPDKCGIVMPISECAGLSGTHWEDVRTIIISAAKEAGYEARLVSETFETNLIHTEILSNIYNDAMVIIDVSGQNPNVFFELGIRMATQKPTVVIKDNETKIPFDLGPNRYVEYPRDLRHPTMEKFKKSLLELIKKTAEQTEAQSFIGQLGTFKVPDVATETVPADTIMMDLLKKIDRNMSPTFPKKKYRQAFNFQYIDDTECAICIRGFSRSVVKTGLEEYIQTEPAASFTFSVEQISDNHQHVTLYGDHPFATNLEADIGRYIRNVIPF